MLNGFPLPLSGLRVLDLTSVIYGPYATQILGDFGADIVKIEPPEGDMTRAIGPGRSVKMSALYLGSNRNKRSVVLNLKKDKARQALWRLIDGADMLVHNMRPQKMAALGFGPDSVLARNPGIVYGALLGYHQDGPYGGMPAYDDVIQGQSGLAGTFTARDGEPVLMPTIVADKTAALQASNGLLAENIDALYQLVGKALAQKTTGEWLRILQAAEIPAGAVNRLEDLRGDEHLNAIGFFRSFEHPTEGDLEIPDTPYRLDGKPLPVHRHQPRLGEHTREVLTDAGLSDAEIDAVIENEMEAVQ